jgi:hypothetical protein
VLFGVETGRVAITVAGIVTTYVVGTVGGTAVFEITTNVVDLIVTTGYVDGTEDPGIITGECGSEVYGGKDTV